jgi:hypothetical protein
VTKFKSISRTLNSFAKEVILESKKELQTQGKSNTGALAKSLGYDLKVDKDGFVLKFLDTRDKPYADFIDKGVSGVMKKYNTPYKYLAKKPPAGALTEWVASKRFQFRDKKGRFLSYKTMGYIISNSIFKRGIKPSMFFTKPFKKAFEKLPDRMFNDFIVELDDFYSGK